MVAQLVSAVHYFYPRPPRGGRLPGVTLCAGFNANFYPRPPRGGRHKAAATAGGTVYFYPRPPRGGRLSAEQREEIEHLLFLPTPSTRRATGRHRLPRPAAENFYPRPPRGGRLETAYTEGVNAYFYPRPPRGGRLWSFRLRCPGSNFYPRPPRGGRRERLNKALG